jgi:hypothetical protein
MLPPHPALHNSAHPIGQAWEGEQKNPRLGKSALLFPKVWKISDVTYCVHSGHQRGVEKQELER